MQHTSKILAQLEAKLARQQAAIDLTKEHIELLKNQQNDKPDGKKKP